MGNPKNMRKIWRHGKNRSITVDPEKSFTEAVDNATIENKVVNNPIGSSSEPSATVNFLNKYILGPKTQIKVDEQTKVDDAMEKGPSTTIDIDTEDKGNAEEKTFSSNAYRSRKIFMLSTPSIAV